ncbi:MAG: hypothetical protein ACLP5V_03060 [Candidatus Bathyarchaeia archaeon]
MEPAWKTVGYSILKELATFNYSEIALSAPQTPCEKYPPDPELTLDESKQYQDLMNGTHWEDALELQQAFLLKKRLSSLNSSSKRLERATIILLTVTVILLGVTILSILFRKTP